MEQSQIEHILRKRISDSDKIKLIKELISADESVMLGFNKMVRLHPNELKKLNDEYTSLIIENFIHRLDGYLYRTGKKYASHYLTILNWLRKDGIKPLVRTLDWQCSFGNLHKAGENCNCFNS